MWFSLIRSYVFGPLLGCVSVKISFYGDKRAASRKKVKTYRKLNALREL